MFSIALDEVLFSRVDVDVFGPFKYIRNGQLRYENRLFGNTDRVPGHAPFLLYRRDPSVTAKAGADRL